MEKMFNPGAFDLRRSDPIINDPEECIRSIMFCQFDVMIGQTRVFYCRKEMVKSIVKVSFTLSRT